MAKSIKVSFLGIILAFAMFFGIVSVNAAQVTYHANNGTTDSVTLGVPNGIEINVETIFNASGNTFEKTGYGFTGWYDHEDWTLGSRITRITYNASQRPNLYARWELEYYDISYDLVGGTVDGTNPTTYHYKDNPTLIINPTKEGYEFIGWTGTDLDEPTMQLAIRDDWTGDRSYTANYKKKVKLIVRYLDSKGNPIADEVATDYLEGDSYTAEGPIEKEGYVLDESKMPTIEGEFGTEDIYVDYYYNKLLTVNFETDGGTPVDPISDVVEGSTIDLSGKTTTKDGYTFDKWYTDSDLTKEFDASTPILENLTLFAKWIKNEEEKTPEKIVPTETNNYNKSTSNVNANYGPQTGISTDAAVWTLIVVSTLSLVSLLVVINTKVKEN